MTRHMHPRHRHLATLRIQLAPAAAVVVAVSLFASGRSAASAAGPETREAEIAAFNQSAEDAGALGTYWDQDAAELVAVMPMSAAFPRFSAPFAYRFEFVSLEQGRIDSALLDLERMSADTPSTYAFFFSPELARIVVDVVGPTDAFDKLAARDPGLLEVRSAPDGGRSSYYTDAAPHRGGAHITAAGRQCTSGFAVKKVTGIRYMTTAAHCYAMGANPISPGNGSSFGTVQERGPYPQVDAELLGGVAYRPDIYTGNFPGTSKVVLSAADPVVGASAYCMSGSYTYGNCGFEVEALDGTLCDPPGVCTGNLIVFCCGTGVAYGGDSGGPFYIQGSYYVNIRGMFIGRVLSHHYATKWSTIQNTFGVSIVAG